MRFTDSHKDVQLLQRIYDTFGEKGGNIIIAEPNEMFSMKVAMSKPNEYDVNFKISEFRYFHDPRVTLDVEARLVIVEGQILSIEICDYDVTFDSALYLDEEIAEMDDEDILQVLAYRFSVIL